MEKQKSIKTNIIMSIILTTSNLVFPLLTYSYAARILMAEGTGKVAFVQSILAYFSYIASLGIMGYGTRECAKVRNDKKKLSKLVQEILIINFISTIAAYVILVITVIFIAQFHAYKMLFIVMSSSILLQTIGMEWLYKSLEKYTYITIRSIIFKTVSVALTFLLIKSPSDYVLYGAITTFTISASNILNFMNARKYIEIKRFKDYNMKRHIRPIMVFFMSTVIISIYGHFDTVMLGFMKGDVEVGIYNAALKMKAIVLSVSTAVTSVLIPRMAVYYDRGEKKKFMDLLLKSLRVSCVLLLPFTCFIILNPTDVIMFVCGTEYIRAKMTLIILMICVFALSLTNLLGNQILIPTCNEKRYSMSVFIGLWINLILNSILIPRYASEGAAIATLITEIFNIYWMSKGCKEEISYMLKNLGISKYVYSLLAAITGESLTRYLFKSIPLFFRLCINGVVIFGLYFLILLILKEPVIGEASSAVKKKFKNIGNKTSFKL